MQRRQLPNRQGDQVRATIDLVAPLAHATDTRIKDSYGDLTRRARSRAVSALIGQSLRSGDVESANRRSTLPTATMPTIRTSTTAIRTTTTRTMSSGLASSADQNAATAPADFSFDELVAAYFDCREHKRNTRSALVFEQDLERNLIKLYDELKSGTYRPGRSICFVITRPKLREVWAADFRDRIVHHLLYNRIASRFYRSFIADSCACIPGRGTLYAAQRLESKVRSITQNWSVPTYYLKCDIANFFVSIDKQILHSLLKPRIPEAWWMRLCEIVLFHDPRSDVEVRDRPQRLALIPPHKSLFNNDDLHGLPIGNLSSQFFANVYLDVLDQFVKHQIGAHHYIRYVDDFVLLHPSAQWLNQAHEQIESLLTNRLKLKLNPTKTILQPIDRGIDFAGQVIKPWCRTIRRRTFNGALYRMQGIEAEDLLETANSYFGLMRQASHSRHDRERLAKQILRRGHAVNSQLTKTFRSNQEVLC